MLEQVDIRYTRLPNGNWVIESTSQVPISVIRGAMSFVDNDGQRHTITEIVTTEGSPEAPYYYFMEAVVTD